MGTRVYLNGLVPATDPKWLAMKKVWDACEGANVQIPEAVSDYFDDQRPDDEGMVMDIDNAVRKREEKGSTIYCVHLDHLPPGLKIVRFEISW